MKISDLKKLPERSWNEKKQYDSLYVINSRKKHDSGFAWMMIIGIIKGEPIEIAAQCDDINWDMTGVTQYEFRTDMMYPSGVIHFWSNGFKFEVGASLSSTDIKLVKANAQST